MRPADEKYIAPFAMLERGSQKPDRILYANSSSEKLYSVKHDSVDDSSIDCKSLDPACDRSGTKQFSSNASAAQ